MWNMRRNVCTHELNNQTTSTPLPSPHVTDSRILYVTEKFWTFLWDGIWILQRWIAPRKISSLRTFFTFFKNHQIWKGNGGRKINPDTFFKRFLDASRTRSVAASFTEKMKPSTKIMHYFFPAHRSEALLYWKPLWLDNLIYFRLFAWLNKPEI